MLTKKLFQIILFVSIFPLIIFGQNSTTKSTSLNQSGALELAKQVNLEAIKLEKNVSIAVLDASGTVILLLKGDNVGPHNTEASRRKAFTALSTKTATLELIKKADANPDSKNLNTIPELLLLRGGVPIWKNGELVGSLGVSCGGGGENDHLIALTAIQNLNFTINK